MIQCAFYWKRTAKQALDIHEEYGIFCLVYKIFRIYKTRKTGRGAAMSEQSGFSFYGSVTVSERGQIVIPAQARRDLGGQR